MAEFIDAGKLDKAAWLLELKETKPGVWEWSQVRRVWANIQFQTKNNLFSTAGLGAKGAAAVIRRQSLTLHHALQWNGQHFFLTAILPRGRGHLDVAAALVTPETVELLKDEDTEPMTFPGVLTEKYARHAQEWPMSVNQLGLVLVVPKAITLRPGCLVRVRGADWEVLVPHELDEYKNEYEIGRTVDL